MTNLHNNTSDSMETLELDVMAACINFHPSPAEETVVSLQGKGGGHYLIHLLAGATIHIKTSVFQNETGRKRKSNWEFDATALGSIEVKLEENKLKIGTCTVHLPDSESPDEAVGQVRVITEKGVVNAVDLAFQTIYFDGVDGRFFEAPDDAANTLAAALVKFTFLDVDVRHIGLDGRNEAVKYSFKDRTWLVGDEVVDYTQLRVSDRCHHQVTEVSV